ncbi:protein VACUOLELESS GAMETOPHYTES [Hevea brasiliensis]|uniref:protein VACUOLELESS GAMETOPHYTES n=1 Tax=Hevea brasiliensis TaxID=3981 RepID=UPI0025D0D83E|nr:protein VACUOLELESS GAMETOPHYTES [Hevea brasiliensis]
METLPSSIGHPAHVHPLTLIPSPAYPSGAFTCNGCGGVGRDSCYRCNHCNYDLHTACAAAQNPPSLTHHSHPHHQLHLTFLPPYPSKAFSCNICQNIGRHWSYHCGLCNFDAHVDCAKLGHQHYNSSPQANSQFQQYGNRVNSPHGGGLGPPMIYDVAHGFAYGVGQQAGQNFVNGIYHPDPNHGGGGDFPSSSSDQSSFLDNIFD